MHGFKFDVVPQITNLINASLGVAQFAGMSIGSYIGTHYAGQIGNVWIKRMVILLAFVMAVMLLF